MFVVFFFFWLCSHCALRPATKESVLYLPITLQAMDVLMIDKNVLKEAATRARICPDINPNLLLNFLMMFKPDEFAPRCMHVD